MSVAAAAILTDPTLAVEISLEDTKTPASSKTPRLPRWTRQEILVLIEGKRVVENRVRRGRASFGQGQLEPKWESVSSYCKRHGVNRGPVQCRKRWSNLAGDYKKIKEWENQIKEEGESFWVMRNDLRRDRKLPGFFDREVYDIMNGADLPNVGVDLVTTGLALALVPKVEAVNGDAEAVFDSGRSFMGGCGGADDGLFSDDEEEDLEENETPPHVLSGVAVAAPDPISGRVGDVKEPLAYQKGVSSSHDIRKRKRYSAEDGDAETSALSLQDRLVDVLEKNGKMLHSQLEVHNNNIHLDREQRKDNAVNLVEVLNKMADAMVKIAEKL